MAIQRIAKEKLFPYSIKEDIANSISHGIAALLVLILNVVLIYKASISGNITAVVTFAIYGYSVMLMFLMSCLYHGIRHVMTRDVFKRLDHSFIYIAITATYCPIVFVGIKTDLSYWVFGILCLITVFGLIFKAFYAGRFKIVSTIIYIIMGWAAIFLIPQMIETLSFDFLFYIFLGGVFYTIGAILYAVGKFPYHHFIWHLFVLLGALSHYYAILMYLL